VEKPVWSCRSVLSPSLILWIYGKLTNHSGELTNMVFCGMENTFDPAGLSSLLLTPSGSTGSSQIILGSSQIWYSAGWKILLILQVCPLSFSHPLDLQEAHKLFWGAHKYDILRDGKYFWSCRSVLSPSLILWIYWTLTNCDRQLTNCTFE
jgi:hypothetical protein